jgi:uncharacterized protein (UPF0248 family)
MTITVRLREFLDGLEWRGERSLGDLEFLVMDRGAPADRRVVRAPEVVGRDRSYIRLEGGGSIPFHRVLEVRSGQDVLWRKRGHEGGSGP